MTQFTCSHCGQPVQAGNLCANCQTLRTYHPDVFFAQNNNTGTGVDKSVLFAVASVVVLALLVGISWPFVQKSMKTSNSVASTPPVVRQPEPAEIPAPVVYTPPRTYNLPVMPQTPPPQVPQPIYQRNKGPFMPSVAYASPVTTIRFNGNNSQEASQSLPAFIDSYCAQHRQRTGKYVRSTGVTMMLDGAGAVLTFDEDGLSRQGSASYTPNGGWAWVQSPDV